MIKTRVPPGPKALLPLTQLIAFRNDPIPFLERLTAKFGDTAYFKAAGRRIYFFNNPESVQDVLVTHQHSFRKGLALRRTKSAARREPADQ